MYLLMAVSLIDLPVIVFLSIRLLLVMGSAEEGVTNGGTIVQSNRL
jgi:hypothetical protein